jgi:hypothetical protein
MKLARQRLGMLVALLIVLMIGLAVIGTSVRLLPDAPLYPTPTQSKGIDFPDSRPLPAYR